MFSSEINPMQTISTVPTQAQSHVGDRSSERGAALLTALLITMLLLVAGGALIMTTAMSASNAADSTAEMQAYYAAEAGMQSALNVLRGNVAPLTLAGNSTDLVTFRQAITSGDMSRWITYSTGYATPRVPITAGYAPISGMAYNIAVTDPDNTGTVTFSVSGAFPSTLTGNPLTFNVGTTNQDKATITYTPPATNPVTINSSGTAPFGSFQITPEKPSQFNAFSITGSALYPNGIDFNLTLTQTSPYPSSSSSPTTVVIACKITGVISSTVAQNTVQFSFVPPTNNATSTSNFIGGVTYARGSNNFPIAFNTAVSISPITVTAPEPRRVKIQSTGYGPRASEKRMQMMVSRFAFDYAANAAITIRSADNGDEMLMFDVGNSANYAYSGFDNAGGPTLPAIGVTNAKDYLKVSTVLAGNTQVTGTGIPSVQQVPIANLPTFLQTAQGARDAVDYMREKAKKEFWPVGTTGEANDRYFPAGTTPNTFGTVTDPVTTFIDGDAALPPGGGAGLLIVTGTLDMRGNADFKGLVMVLGTGKVLRNGGGNGSTLGAMMIASFGPTGDFLQPYFDSNGGGIAGFAYDSKWIDKALSTSGPSVIAVSEY